MSKAPFACRCNLPAGHEASGASSNGVLASTMESALESCKSNRVLATMSRIRDTYCGKVRSPYWNSELAPDSLWRAERSATEAQPAHASRTSKTTPGERTEGTRRRRDAVVCILRRRAGCNWFKGGSYSIIPGDTIRPAPSIEARSKQTEQENAAQGRVFPARHYAVVGRLRTQSGTAALGSGHCVRRLPRADNNGRRRPALSHASNGSGACTRGLRFAEGHLARGGGKTGSLALRKTAQPRRACLLQRRRRA